VPVSADAPLTRRTRDAAGNARRTPKTLDEEPTVYETAAGPGAGGVLLRARPGRGRARPAGTASDAGFTDERGELVAPQPPLPGERALDDPAVRARARLIAARLSVRRPRAAGSTRRGAGELASLPDRGGADDIDLDRTLEILAAKPVLEPGDVVVRERVREPRAVVLAVDVSGSMRGERALTAAATVGALAAELDREALGVLAFWSDAAVLLSPGDPVRPDAVVDALVALPSRGLTNVAFPLDVAASELARVPARDARVVLLSDCVHNAGPDPRPLAARLPRLDVLLDASGERDVELGRELARLGRGTFSLLRTYHDVAPALGNVFRD
jgi:Mg-chelatase subunit ChlD